MKITQQHASNRGRAVALASLFVACLIAMFGTTAYADALATPTNAVAREHLVTANRYYRLREFEKAVEEYKAGALREDAPVFYYNLGQCYRQLGRYEDALWHYERFLERGQPTGEVEVIVREFIAQMKGEIEQKEMKQPPGDSAPPPPRTYGKLGQVPRDVTEQRSGMPFQQKLAIGGGIGGVAVIGLGFGLGLRARLFRDDAARVCPVSPCERSDEANELIDRGRTNALYANVGFGIGGAAILGAIVLWITGAPPKHKTIAIVPQVSHTFSGATAVLKF